MNDIIKIDTGQSLKQIDSKLNSKVEPLVIYDEYYPLMKLTVPEVTPNEMNSISYYAKRMKYTMKHYMGVGLSGNQVGLNKRVFVIGFDDYDLVCINPVILQYSEETEKGVEGCLSFPGLHFKVERSKWILTEFMDEYGEKKVYKLEGLTARIFQHELDHLNGICYTERVGKATLIRAREKQKLMMKKIKRM